MAEAALQRRRDKDTLGLAMTRPWFTDAPKTTRSAKNVYGRPLEDCGHSPKTGFFRDGCCNTNSQDVGAHVVCTKVTEEFLAFSKARGNDLSTPSPAHGFPGLKPGDRWCLCAMRWKEALEAGIAPPVLLAATHERVLDTIELDELERHALDLN